MDNNTPTMYSYPLISPHCIYHLIITLLHSYIFQIQLTSDYPPHCIYCLIIKLLHSYILTFLHFKFSLPLISPTPLHIPYDYYIIAFLHYYGQ